MKPFILSGKNVAAAHIIAQAHRKMASLADVTIVTAARKQQRETLEHGSHNG